MRFLHTADWHIGRTIRGRSRAAETEAALAQVVAIARDEAVDCVLVCGDIWDSAAPTPEADRILFEALRECIGHGIQVVLLAGNHDSARKLEALGLLSELLGVQTQWKVRRPDAGGVLTIEGPEHAARLAAIPFVREGDLIDAAQVMGLQEQWFPAYNDGAGAVYRGMCAGFTPQTVNLLLGHVFVNGATYATRDGSERALHIGQAYGIEPAGLPAQPQYIALGHIHRPQQIHEAPVHTEYAGSLLQLDFGEVGQEKRVIVFDAVPGRPVREIRSIPITQPRPLVDLRGTLDEVLARVSTLGDAHVRVTLAVERVEPGLAQRVRDQVGEQAGGDVQVVFEYPEQPAPESTPLAGMSAEEQFVRYYRAQHGADPDPELLATFRELQDDAAIAASEFEEGG